MVQSLNLQGVLAIGQVIRNPSLMLPHVSVKHIGFLDFELLRQAGEFNDQMRRLWGKAGI